MYLKRSRRTPYCYTGGKAFDANAHRGFHPACSTTSVWLRSILYLATAVNVLAVDLPGHCRSATSARQWRGGRRLDCRPTDAAQVQRAALVGHSWDSLIALEAAARLRDRITHLAGWDGRPYHEGLAPALLDAAPSA